MEDHYSFDGKILTLKQLLEALLEADQFHRFFDPLLRKKQVHAMLGIGKSLFEEWVKTGKFPPPDYKEWDGEGTNHTLIMWRLSTVRRWIDHNTIDI